MILLTLCFHWLNNIDFPLCEDVMNYVWLKLVQYFHTKEDDNVESFQTYGHFTDEWENLFRKLHFHMSYNP